MNQRLRFLAAAIAAATIIVVSGAITTNAGTSFATANQPVPWACNPTTVCNNTGCATTLTLRTQGAGTVTISLPPAGCVPVSTPGYVGIYGLQSFGGLYYPVQQPPPTAPSSCGPTDWSINCVTLAPGCCCDVCFNPTTCTITVNPSACPPGSCRP